MAINANFSTVTSSEFAYCHCLSFLSVMAKTLPSLIVLYWLPYYYFIRICILSLSSLISRIGVMAINANFSTVTSSEFAYCHCLSFLSVMAKTLPSLIVLYWLPYYYFIRICILSLSWFVWNCAHYTEYWELSLQIIENNTYRAPHHLVGIVWTIMYLLHYSLLVCYVWKNVYLEFSISLWPGYDVPPGHQPAPYWQSWLLRCTLSLSSQTYVSLLSLI